MTDAYDEEEGPATEATASEVIEATDGPMSARVTVEATGPDLQSTSQLAEALAAANRSVVHTVFSGPGDEPERGNDGGDTGVGRLVSESGHDPAAGTEDDGSLMGWDGKGGGDE